VAYSLSQKDVHLLFSPIKNKEFRMLTLWGRENSSNVKKVLWLLDELNVTFQHITVAAR